MSLCRGIESTVVTVGRILPPEGQLWWDSWGNYCFSVEEAQIQPYTCIFYTLVFSPHFWHPPNTHQIQKRQSSGSMDDRPLMWVREYVESLHQNSRTTLLFGKNNVLVQPVCVFVDLQLVINTFFQLVQHMHTCMPPLPTSITAWTTIPVATSNDKTLFEDLLSNGRDACCL